MIFDLKRRLDFLKNWIIIYLMVKGRVWRKLNSLKPGIIALLDPDRILKKDIFKLTEYICNCDINAILIGSSLLKTEHFDDFVIEVKKAAKCPVILFPGGSHQVSRYADAIFFLSLLSGRNPEFLIGEHVKAVFLIKSYGIEVIPVGYILISSGNYTAVEYVSNTRPIPRDKPEIVLAHAIAGEYLGMKAIYLEAGSGAKEPVPEEIIREVKKQISIPLIVGGGIRKVDDAKRIIDAGADFIVLGSIIETSPTKFKKIIQSIEH